MTVETATLTDTLNMVEAEYVKIINDTLVPRLRELTNYAAEGTGTAEATIVNGSLSITLGYQFSTDARYDIMEQAHRAIFLGLFERIISNLKV